MKVEQLLNGLCDSRPELVRCSGCGTGGHHEHGLFSGRFITCFERQSHSFEEYPCQAANRISLGKILPPNG